MESGGEVDNKELDIDLSEGKQKYQHHEGEK